MRPSWPPSARKSEGNIYVGAALVLMLAALTLALALAAQQTALGKWLSGWVRDAQAYYAALTGLERFKPLCAGVLDPRVAVPGTTAEVAGAAGPVGGGAAVERVTAAYTYVSEYAVEADVTSVGSSGGVKVAVRAPVRAEWAVDNSGAFVLVRAAFTGPALRTAVP